MIQNALESISLQAVRTESNVQSVISILLNTEVMVRLCHDLRNPSVRGMTSLMCCVLTTDDGGDIAATRTVVEKVSGDSDYDWTLKNPCFFTNII